LLKVEGELNYVHVVIEGKIRELSQSICKKIQGPVKLSLGLNQDYKPS
jgi:hypothetical protein